MLHNCATSRNPGNVLKKIRANFWRGFLAHFCLEAENLPVFAVLRACRMRSPGFADSRVLKHVDLKARNCNVFLLTENPIYLKDVLSGQCLEYREEQRGHFCYCFLRSAFSCFLPRIWRVNLLTAAMLKCARREMGEHQSCFSAEVRKAQQLCHSVGLLDLRCNRLG